MSKPRSDLDLYLTEVATYPLLSAEEECDLAARAQRGDKEARDRMVCCNLRLVVFVARWFEHRGLSLADLIAEGNLGLFRAVDGYDPSRGTRFSTYATWWVKNAIRNAIRVQSRAIRIAAPIWQMLSGWTMALVKYGSEAKAAKALGLTDGQVFSLREAMRYCLPLPDEADEKPLLLRRPRESELSSPEDVEHVRRAMQCLPSREALVLRQHYGIDGPARTLREIGLDLGLTRERVRQIEVMALRRLREEMA